MNITERINRVLFILSYVSQNQGVRVEELAEKAGMPPKQLLKELEFIILIGKPPFKPDDYVDIYVEEQRVFIEFDQKLNRPLRFTRPEAMALLMSLELLDPEVDPVQVGSLKKKIQQLISESVDSSTRLEDRILLERPSALSEKFSQIREAIESRQKIGIEYYALTRDHQTSRVIRPYLLLKHLGFWYLTGYCEMRRDLRTFKLERILSVDPQLEGFESPDDFDVDKYKENFLSSMGSQQFEIHFEEKLAPWIRERWGDAVRDAEKGGAVLRLHSETMEYPSRLVLENAPHARPLSPPEFIEKVRSDARTIAEVYQSKAVV